MPESTLIKKLRIKEGYSVALINSFPGYIKLLSPLPSNVSISTKLKDEYDSISLFVNNKAELEKNITACKKVLKETGILWICYPKKSAKINSDLDRDTSWTIGVQSGLRGIASVAIDETWTALGLKHGAETPKTKSQKKDEGEIAKFVDIAKRVIKLPDDFKKELTKDKSALELFNSLSFSHRKEFVVWIVTAKREETRNERITKTIEKLIAGKKNPSQK